MKDRNVVTLTVEYLDIKKISDDKSTSPKYIKRTVEVDGTMIYTDTQTPAALFNDNSILRQFEEWVIKTELPPVIKGSDHFPKKTKGMKKIINMWLDRRLKKWCIKNIPKSPYPTTKADMGYYTLYFDWIKSI